MDKFSFEIPGEPIPKGRPRLGAGGRVYTPQRTRDYERNVAIYARQAGGQMREGPVALWICVYPKKRTMDLDNVIKTISDALNGIAYYDDSQVVYIKAQIVELPKDGAPYVFVTVGYPNADEVLQLS